MGRSRVGGALRAKMTRDRQGDVDAAGVSRGLGYERGRVSSAVDLGLGFGVRGLRVSEKARMNAGACVVASGPAIFRDGWALFAVDGRGSLYTDWGWFAGRGFCSDDANSLSGTL